MTVTSWPVPHRQPIDATNLHVIIIMVRIFRVVWQVYRCIVNSASIRTDTFRIKLDKMGNKARRCWFIVWNRSLLNWFLELNSDAVFILIFCFFWRGRDGGGGEGDFALYPVLWFNLISTRILPIDRWLPWQCLYSDTKSIISNIYGYYVFLFMTIEFH